MSALLLWEASFPPRKKKTEIIYIATLKLCFLNKLSNLRFFFNYNSFLALSKPVRSADILELIYTLLLY